jgi:putative membrane protein
MMWYWGGGVHWWGWLLGFVVMVVFWAVVVWAIWYFVASLLGRQPRRDELGSAQRILDERLARGEIDTEEYRRLRGVLRGEDQRVGAGHGAGGPGGFGPGRPGS